MKILLSWLHEHLPTKPTATEVQNALVSVGIEVSQVKNLSAGLEDVVVAKLLERNKHPDADRLSLCKVTDGKETYSIVCGANNMKSGDVVAMARIGAHLPNGITLKKSKIRGVESEGMLCSESELGFSTESEGILILPQSAPIGAPLADYLKRNDTVIELELTPNRGDCLSVIGVSREVAAALDISPKGLTIGGDGPKDGKINAFVHDKIGSPRYVLHHLDEMAIGDSPEIISTRLQNCGIRSINNVVDITNYIMLEWGQPMHAFDKNTVVGPIQVRRSKDGEKILCLDEVERTLTATDLVIADNEGPMAIAGVIGGLRTAVTNKTNSILLESAAFEPKSVRFTANRLGIHTESSHRFERGVDSFATWNVSLKAVELLSKYAKGSLVTSIDLRASLGEPKKITLRKSAIERILGEDIKKAGEYLARLGFSVQKIDAGWVVEIPSRRGDVEREIDLIEEVARLHGYNTFASTIPKVTNMIEPNQAYEGLDQIRNLLKGAGVQEAQTYSFSSREDLTLFGPSVLAEKVEVTNPIAEGMEWMRQSLIPGLVKVWKSNQARQKRGAKLFEIGKVFGKDTEEYRLTICFAGEINSKQWTQKERVADFYDGRGIVESIFNQLQLSGLSFEPLPSSSTFHSGKSAKIVWRKKDVGTVGELHPRLLREQETKGPVVIVDFSFPTIVEALIGETRYKPFSTYPTVERDLAFFVKKEVSAEKVVSEVKKLRDPLVQDVEIFDYYVGKGVPEGEVSLAIRMTFGAMDRTLTEEEIDPLFKKIIAHIQMTCSAKLRGEL